MYKSVLISLFILFCGILKAQDYKLLSGKISHPNLVVAGIHVINADRGLAEITDIDGNFEISVAIGEKLIFSGVQYKKRALEITSEIFALDQITVYLEEYINELDEVVITYKDRLCRIGYDLISFIFTKYSSANIVIENVEDKQQQQEITEDLMEIITVYSSRLYGARSGKKSKKV